MDIAFAEITTLIFAVASISGVMLWSLWPVLQQQRFVTEEGAKTDSVSSIDMAATLPPSNPSLAEQFDPPPAYDLVCMLGNSNGRPKSGERIPFPATYLLIGRDDECDVIIENANGVSRHHASITFQDDKIFLNDMNSSNGTWVDNRKVDSVELELNQSFEIGPCLFAVVEQGATPIEAVANDQTLSTIEIEQKEIKDYVLAIADYLKMTVLHQLGQGGTASVFKCQQGSDVVALKILHNREPYFRKKFDDEVKAMTSLGNHPNVVNILDSGVEFGYPYIVMECMDGGSVKDRMNRKGVMAAAETVDIIGRVCKALAYAHTNGIIHRDLKPENILLNRAGEAKLADFGIAKLTETGTKTQVGVIIGTPKYLSYEQATSRPVTAGSDQYSLAIVMFEMLTGYVPFTGNPYEVITKHIDELAPSPKIYNSAVSQQHAAALLKALNKSDEERYASITAFAEAIGYSITESMMGDEFLEERLFPIAPPFISGVQGFSGVDKISINSSSLILGRAMLPDRPPHVSATHAEIKKVNDDYFIRDLGSKNGTYVNRLLVEPDELMKLEHGCYINLGSTMIQFNLY
ncbi:MAG: protein kinase [Chloroflexota bacterium]